MPEYLTPLPAGMLTAVQINNVLLFAITISPASVSANTTVEQTFAITSLPVAVTAAVVVVSKPTLQAGLGIVGSRISSAGNIGISFINNTGSPIVPTASEVYSVLVVS